MNFLPAHTLTTYSLTSNWISISLITLFILQSLGCSRPLEEPELIDPIYLDLLKTSSEYANEHKTALSAAKEAREQLKDRTPGTIEVKQARKTLNENKSKLTHLAQMSLYYEIKAKKRRIEARSDYHQALKRGESWPKPEDYQNFLSEKKLRNASKNWNKRVPKLSARTASN